MKTMVLIFALLSTFTISVAAQQTTTYKDSLGVEHTDVYPEFTGGEEAMYRFLDKTMVYPKEARKKNITGKVIVSFIVDKYGNVSNVELVKGIGGGCDEEAIRVVELMPRWKPGTQDGRAVNVKFNFPINFTLK